MTFERFTIKAQEVIREAVNTAQIAGQQTIEPIHLLKGMMTNAKDITGFVFSKLGVNAGKIETLLDNEISHLPRVQGGEPYLSADTNKVLMRAQDISKEMG